MSVAWHQPRGDHDPFSPHEPAVGEPAASDPSGGGGADLTPRGLAAVLRPIGTPQRALPPAPQTPAPAPVKKVRRRPSRRKKTTAGDDRLAADLAALERPDDAP